MHVAGTLYVVRKIANAVHNVLNCSPALVCLELKNVLLDDRSVNALISGVKDNHTLQHLSLAYGRVGDDACSRLCIVLRNKPNVRSLDLTGCGLSSSSGLVDLMKKQQYKRNEECWAHSLRSRVADPNIMPGLRR